MPCSRHQYEAVGFWREPGTDSDPALSASTWVDEARDLVRAGLSGGSPQSRVLDVVLEGTRRRRAACSRCPSAGDEAVQRCIVPQVLDETGGVATAVAIGIPQLDANLGAAPLLNQMKSTEQAAGRCRHAR